MIEAKTENSFAQWAKEYVLPCLNKETLSEEEAIQIAKLAVKFEKSIKREITESDFRNLLEKGSKKHAQMSRVINQFKKIRNSFEPKHCETIKEWVHKNILGILFKEGFNIDTAKTICLKLKRKKAEKKWFIHPQDLNLMIEEKDIIEAQQKVVIDLEEIRQRINLVESYFDEE